MRLYLIILIIIGFVWGGFLGALMSILMGLWFLQSSSAQLFTSPLSLQKKIKPQRTFFKTTFLMMGYMAKIDGRINQLEINSARQIMNALRLSMPQKKYAISLFNQGKLQLLDVPSLLLEFKGTVTSSQLPYAFLEIQLQIALSDGEVTHAEQTLLNKMCTILELNPQILQELQRHMNNNQGAHYSQFHTRKPQGFTEQKVIQEAYQLLNVTPSASIQDIKQAYRKLMSQHHPDKLMAKGLSESRLELEKQKTQKIQAAYELLQRIHKTK